MAELFSTSQVSAMKTSTSPRPLTPNRLRKRLTKENTNSLSLVGVKIKRISEFENYSSSSRGTLGGFLPVSDMGSPDSDSCGIDKVKHGEKECVLTQFTKKIGLGIYTRARDVAAEKGVGGGHLDLDGDERETWHMFYPPPPSPSLALEPEDLDVTSSSGTDGSLSAPSVPNLAPRANSEVKDQSRLSAFTRDSLYTASNPRSPIEEQLKRDNGEEDMDIDALIHSAENLAEQYRELLLSPDPVTPLNRSKSYSERLQSPLPFPSPLSFPTPVSTPKTIRKVKRQHSLRKLVDDAKLPPRTYITPSSTPIPSPPWATQSPSFLSSTVYPVPLHPTKLALAAHPTRSPTPSQKQRRKSRSKNKRPSNLSQPPEPPPRSSSRNRARSAKKRSKGRADHAKEAERGTRGEAGPGDRTQRRGRSREARRYGQVETVEDGVIDGGEGWV